MTNQIQIQKVTEAIHKGESNTPRFKGVFKCWTQGSGVLACADSQAAGWIQDMKNQIQIQKVTEAIHKGESNTPRFKGVLKCWIHGSGVLACADSQTAGWMQDMTS